MKVLLDLRARKEIKKLNKSDIGKVFEYIELFEEYGFGLTEKYLKKIDRNVWELRPKRLRVFLIKLSPDLVVIHIMVKKSQKITKATRQLLDQRRKAWIK